MNTTDGDTARATDANALPVWRRLSMALSSAAAVNPDTGVARSRRAVNRANGR
jgi:hypothetical protein